MAKLIFEPIGSKVDERDPPLLKNHQLIEALEERLRAKRREIAQGWGESYQARVRDKGKMTAHERVQKLADSLDDIFPINTFVNDALAFGEDKKRSPNAGVITAFVRIGGRYVMVIANDNTVASGSWWPHTPEKIIRAQEIALKLRLPVIYLVDCSGLYLPEQGATFPGKTGAGHIFKMNSLLSDQGVPQIAGVCGDCIAGGGYMPIISDRVFMTEQAYMVIAGAALIRGAKSQHLSSHDIGGPHVHVHLSNCADERVPDDQTLLVRIKDEIRKLPSSATEFYRGNIETMTPSYRPDELSFVVPAQVRESYDIREVLARLLDSSLFYEFEPSVGREVVCGVGRVSGLAMGFLANSLLLFDHPLKTGQQRAGGILYREGVKKLARFCRALNDDGIPMCWLQDVSGFDVGIEAEKQGLLSYGSSLIYANSTHQTPMMTVLLRKASGAGYYAMAGMPYDPVLQLSTCLSRLAVMEGQTLAIGAYHTKLDDNFQIATRDPEERIRIEKGMEEVSARIEADMDPYKAASQMDTDEIVTLSEIRKYLACFAECSYQASGYRRIKNPRIWSLHDLQV
ncbi:MAG TPA: carboxyl transferase domain-containing protein [Myxococcota bacterium]|nr:carboxyl transferase domain-containing protein [Myxococcota bacterium]